MYTPKHFKVSDATAIDDFIRNNHFGQLSSRHDGRLCACHVPFVYDSAQRLLLAHVAKANPQHQSLSGQEVLVTFAGPHGYVSPQWYEQGGVPTWNYQSAHVYGVAQTFSDPERLAFVVKRLSEINEQSMPTPWQPDYPPAMHQAIVGIEIQITDIQCQFKLSQNKSMANQRRVMDQLKAQGHLDLAEAMQKQIQEPD